MTGTLGVHENRGLLWCGKIGREASQNAGTASGAVRGPGNLCEVSVFPGLVACDWLKFGIVNSSCDVT